jgi:hypothetical protein
MTDTLAPHTLSTTGLEGLARLASYLQQQLEQCQAAITAERRRARGGSAQ